MNQIPEMKPLFIRADAAVEIGTGHIMRCLALAQAWQDQEDLEVNGRRTEEGERHCVVFICAELPTALERKLLDENCEVIRIVCEPGSAEDTQETVVAMSRRLKGSRPSSDVHSVMTGTWLVIDGYFFGTDYQRRAKDAGVQLMVMDDYGHADHYFADLVVNQNVTASRDPYVSREPYTRLLLGIRFAALRREFLRWRAWQREISPMARKVLVTMGGSDPGNVTKQVLQILDGIHEPDIEVEVLAGASNPHLAELRVLAERTRHRTTIMVNAPDVASRMAWADVAISAAGSTCWELIFMQLPFVAITTAPNQNKIASALAKLNVCFDAGEKSIAMSLLDSELTPLIREEAVRSRMVANSRSVVDGWGAPRVIAGMQRAGFMLRQAVVNDTRFFWMLANDLTVREASLKTTPIEWDEHVKWFNARLQDPQTLLLLAEIDGKDAGYARFSLGGDAATVSVALTSEFRQQGWGRLLVSEGMRCLRRWHPAIRVVNADIKPENRPSQLLFQKIGFCCVDRNAGQYWRYRIEMKEEVP